MTSTQPPVTAADRTEADQGLALFFVDDCAQPGGAQLALDGLIRALAERDDVMLGGALVTSTGPMVARLAKTIDTTSIPEREGARSGLDRNRVRLRALPGLLGESRDIRRAIKRFRRDFPDGHVYFNTIRSFGVARPLIPRSAPVVVHLRDRLEGNYGERAQRIITLLLRRADIVIANSNGTKREFVRAGVRADKVAVVPSPLRPEFSDGRRNDVPIDRHVIACVAAITPWKGQHLAIRAVKALIADGVDVTLHVIGGPLFGELEYEQLLMSEAGDHLDQAICFHGHVDDVPKLLADLGAGSLVHTSVLPEPLGMVVVEGMSLGLATVAADAGGPQEIIDHGETGYLFEPADVDSLIAQIRAAIGPAGAEVAARGPDAVSGKFEPASIAARTVDILTAV